jgi:PKD repeat protein
LSRHLAIPACLLVLVCASRPADANLVTNPSFELDTNGWALYGSGATMTRVVGGRTGASAVQCRGTSSTSLHFGINDAPNWIGTVAGVGTRYRFSCWVRSDAGRGQLKMKVKEFLGSTQKGATAYSTPVTLSTSWQQATVDYVVTTAGTTLDLVIEDYPVVGLETYLIDDVSIEIVPGTAPPNDPPVARLTVTELASPALSVRADASGSTDTDAMPIASYRFDFGDGSPAIVTNAPTAIAQHAYSDIGKYVVSLIVTDSGGLASAPVTASIVILPPDDPPLALLTVTTLATPARTVMADGSGSTDTDVTPIATYRFDFGDGTPAVVTTEPTATAQHTYANPGDYVVSLIATDTRGLASGPATASVSLVAPNAAPIARLSITNLPSPSRTVVAGGYLSTDTDAKPIASYRFDFGDGTPPVVTTEPSTSAQHAYAADGPYNVSLIATDTGGLSSAPVTMPVTVTSTSTPPPTNLVQNASFETNLAGWELYGSGSTMTRVAGGHTGGFAVQCRGTSSTSLHFGINDSPNWVATVAGVGTRYRLSCWLRSDANRGQVKIKVKEFLVSTQKGSTTYSTPVTLSPAWQMATVDYVATTAGTTLDLVIEDYPVAGLETYWIDDVSIENVTGGAPVTDNPPTARLSVAPLASPALSARADASTSTDTDATPIARYRFSFGDGTAAVSTSAPTAAAQHTYVAAGTYVVTLVATDTGGRASAPVSTPVVVSNSPPPPSGGSIAVYAGYYDTHHPGRTQPKPDPWRGSPGVVFVGRPDDSSGGWDSSGLRLDNQTGSPITGVVVTVDIGSKHYALWGTNTIPAGQTLILAQTGFENFDGSDTNPAGCYGCNPTYCVSKVTTTVPVVHVAIGGTTTDYTDPGQILNTHGVDQAGCPYTGTRNDESHAWQQLAPRASLFGSGTQDAEADLRSFGLDLACTNPTRGELALRFSLSTATNVRLDVFDVMGRHMKTLAEGVYQAGSWEAHGDLREFPNGVYFCRLASPERSKRRTFALAH